MILPLIVIISCFTYTTSFRGNQILRRRVENIKSSTTWQEDLDKVLDIDTDCNARQSLVVDVLQKADAISKDIVAAIEEGDIKKLAPPDLKYGKAVEGIKALKRQIVSDILPDLLTSGVPKVREAAPKLFDKFLERAPQRAQDLMSTFQKLAQNPSSLESTIEDLQKELRNVVRSTPEGLYTPPYEIVVKTDDYEIRKYSKYSVCSTRLTESTQSTSDSSMADPISSGAAFNNLAEYLFGKNVNNTKMAMTTPVIIESGSMQFILPSEYSADTAPVPETDKISVLDIDAELVAVREFPGIATDGEVSRERAKLEDALLTDSILYDNLSFKVLQYNPPQTLPFLRRNEVMLKVTYSGVETLKPNSSLSGSGNDFKSNDGSEFFSAPEAGD